MLPVDDEVTGVIINHEKHAIRPSSIKAVCVFRDISQINIYSDILGFDIPYCWYISLISSKWESLYLTDITIINKLICFTCPVSLCDSKYHMTGTLPLAGGSWFWGIMFWYKFRVYWAFMPPLNGQWIYLTPYCHLTINDWSTRNKK